MPKKPNITDEQVAAIVRQTDDVHFAIAEIADEIRDGRSDDLATPIEYARAFTALARVASDAANAILNRASMQEMQSKMKADLESLRKNA